MTYYTANKAWKNIGDHSLLIVSGETLVIYDPAGTYGALPAEKDILYPEKQSEINKIIYRGLGIKGSYTIIQKKSVPIEVANLLIKKIKAEKPAPGGLCAWYISNILHKTSGFTKVKRRILPAKLMEDFSQIAGVQWKSIGLKNDTKYL